MQGKCLERCGKKGVSTHAEFEEQAIDDELEIHDDLGEVFAFVMADPGQVMLDNRARAVRRGRAGRERPLLAWRVG